MLFVDRSKEDLNSATVCCIHHMFRLVIKMKKYAKRYFEQV